MAQNDMLKRYLDAGIAFTQMTRSKAEEIVKDLVTAGEVQRDQMQTQVDELIDRSRRNTDQLLAMIRQEVAAQFAQLGLVTKDDLESLARRLGEMLGVVGRGRQSGAKDSEPDASSPTAPTGATSENAAATKAPATKAPASKAPAKKAPAAGKAPAKKATSARKASAKKAAPASDDSSGS